MDTIDFDPGPGVEERTAGSWDNFIVSLDASGQLLWVLTFEPWTYDVSVGPDGTIAICGSFYGVQDFDPGPGVDERDSDPSSGNDGFVLSLDEAGNLLWVVTHLGEGQGWCNSVALTASGAVLATGLFEAPIDFDPGHEVDLHSPVGAKDVFVTRLLPGGSY
jgi:hypothetical protein